MKNTVILDYKNYFEIDDSKEFIDAIIFDLIEGKINSYTEQHAAEYESFLDFINGYIAAINWRTFSREKQFEYDGKNVTVILQDGREILSNKDYTRNVEAALSLIEDKFVSMNIYNKDEDNMFYVEIEHTQEHSAENSMVFGLNTSISLAAITAVLLVLRLFIR